MLTLAIDLSSPVATLCLLRDSTILRELELAENLRHSELFLGALNELLEGEGVCLPEIDRYLTSSGPGSFTGLRIGWSSLKAFALTQKKPLVVASGDEARARAWLRQHPNHRGPLSFLTPMGKTTWIKSTFEVANSITLKEVTLTEDAALAETFPMRASYLPLCPTPTVLTTSEEISSHSPEYFGSTKWGLK